MNDFRIWDEKENIFIDTSVEQLAISKPLKNKFAMLYWNILPYIGKDDINGNKIYADSSIFEFDFLGFGETEGITYKGFAKWNKQRFRYDIEVLSHEDRDGDNYIFDLGKCIDRVSNLKIIDTIQESKLGLIK